MPSDRVTAYYDELDRNAMMRAMYQEFAQQNPHVEHELVVMAFNLKNRGIETYGIAALWEVLRYSWLITTNDPNSQLKLNNNYKAFYARDIMKKYPDLDGFFTTRKAQADE
jgi:hypothetical protein